MTSRMITLAAFAVLSSGTLLHAQDSPRRHILLDSGWRFQAEPEAELKNMTPITGWRWKTDDNGESDAATYAAPVLDTTGADWRDAAPGQDIFGGRSGYAWARATLPEIPGPQRAIRLLVDDSADVYLNGVKLDHHDGWNDPFVVSLDSAWKTGGPNVLAVLIQNGSGPGGLGTLADAGTNVTARNSTVNAWKTDFNDRKWRTVHLPHDYVVEGTFTKTADANHGSLPTPPAWYRKTFTLPESDRGKSVWIEFEGVYRDSKVWLNGKLLGEHPSGYTGFRYDISQAANFGGKNTLAVSVNPRRYEGWWYEGGGIYRHVWLNVANPVHVMPYGTFVSSSLPEPKPGSPVEPATVTIQTTLANTGSSDAAATVVSQVVDENGAVVATSSAPDSVAAGKQQNVSQQVTVTNPALWSLEARHMYTLKTAVTIGGKTVDTFETPFGIRTIRYDVNKGFFLNGVPVKIQGVCNHQDFIGVGVGVPDTLEAWRVSRMKSIGVNGWRMSHNPPTPSLLDACDRQGMLVMDENRHLGDTYSDHTGSGVKYDDLSDLAELILRDRNHPSVIMWSMCNEEWLQATPEGAKIFTAMMDVVHKYDTTRPISSAMNGGWLDPGFATVEDLIGVNYYPNVYDSVHAKYPEKPMFGSETASTLTTRGVYENDKTNAWVTSYNMTDGSWEPVGSREWMAGSFDWTGFDYKGEPTPYGWPDINSNFGILDMCGYPKDNAFYLKSWWTKEPVLHLLPHWNWTGKEGQNVRVVAFSNAARVELFLNGQSIGAKDMPRLGHLEWQVPYAPGALVAKSYDASGNLITTETDETTGPPAAIVLKADRSALAADGEDNIPVEVHVVDAQGRIVPTANDLVTFSLKGAAHITGVGNGNPSDHDPDQTNTRHAFNGLCMVVVGSNEKGGASRLTASAPGLKSASLDFTAK